MFKSQDTFVGIAYVTKGIRFLFFLYIDCSGDLHNTVL